MGAGRRGVPGGQSRVRRHAGGGCVAAVGGGVCGGRGRRGLRRGSRRGLAGEGLRLRGVLPRGRREHPDPRRHRVHLGARRPPVLQASEGERALPRGRQLPPRAPGPAHRPVTPCRANLAGDNRRDSSAVRLLVRAGVALCTVRWTRAPAAKPAAMLTMVWVTALVLLSACGQRLAPAGGSSRSTTAVSAGVTPPPRALRPQRPLTR